MSREHSPRPGTHWDTRIVPVEQVIPDDADAGHNDPQPRLNRGARRAIARAVRRKQR